MQTTSKLILLWRWAVFLIAAFYAVYMITTADYSRPGGPFRFLTIWALLLSFFCASRVLALSEGRSTRRWHGVLAATAVVNGMVVFLYWSLYFNDPSSVTRNGELGVWWQELYLHAAGPALQWIEALFVSRAFRRPLASLAWLVGFVVAYLTWAEQFVQRFNETPVGSVTTGLPYPFLNNLEWSARLNFYGVNLATGVGLLAVFFVLGWLVNRVMPPQPSSAANKAASPLR